MYTAYLIHLMSIITGYEYIARHIKCLIFLHYFIVQVVAWFNGNVLVFIKLLYVEPG